MPFLAFMIYNLFNTLSVYCYILLTSALAGRLELCAFKKFSHFIYFLLLSAVTSLNNLGYKIYGFVPGYLNLIISFGWIICLFIFTKYNSKVSWLRALLSMLFFAFFSIALEALVVYGIFLLGINFETIFLFIQYFGSAFYAAVSFSLACIIDYCRSEGAKTKPEAAASSQMLPSVQLKYSHYLFIAVSLSAYIFYQLYVYTYNINTVGLLNLSGHFFILIAILFVFYMLLRQNKKHYQALYIKGLENEARTLADYTKTVDSLYADIKHYKHDIQNILLGIRLYIDQNNLEALRTFYYSEVLPLSPVSNPIYQIIANLQPLKHISLKGLICSKIEDTQRNHIDFQIEILEPIEEIPVNAVDLCRAIGILLDNGIESAAQSADKKLILSMDQEPVGGPITFAVQNTFKEKPDLDKMYQLNYSTKGKNRGIGLHSLSAIIAKNKNMSLSYKLDEKFFCQVITLHHL